MKITLFILLFVGCSFARNVMQQTFAEGPRCPIDDPLSRNGQLPINYSFDPLFKLDVGSDASNIIFEGLSTLHYEININALLLTMDFEFTLDRVSGNATYTATGYIDASPISEETIPSGDISGFGFGQISVTGIHIKGRGQLFISLGTNKAIFRTLNFEILKFDTLAIDLGNNITIGGKTINWTEFSANVKENFDREWLEHRPELTEKIRLGINKKIEESPHSCNVLCIPIDPPFDPECKPVP